VDDGLLNALKTSIFSALLMAGLADVIWAFLSQLALSFMDCFCSSTGCNRENIAAETKETALKEL